MIIFTVGGFGIRPSCLTVAGVRCPGPFEELGEEAGLDRFGMLAEPPLHVRQILLQVLVH